MEISAKSNKKIQFYKKIKENDYVVKVKNVSKIFKDKKALDKISFNISKGSFHAIVGENGSGKTTIIRIIIGLYSKEKYTGAVLINSKSISYIAENAIFPKQWKLISYLKNSAKLAKLTPEIANMHIVELREKYKLDDLIKKNPNSLSSGQKKRVLLARAELLDADLVILDEPAANLDFGSREFIFSELRKMADRGKTIIIISHMTKEIEEFIDECTILHFGELMFNGKIKKSDLTNKYSEILREYKKNAINRISEKN